MKRAVIALLCGLTIPALVYSARPSAPVANLVVTPETQGAFQGVEGVADIAELEWVDKRCRAWAPDGDIDVDQTCLVVQTVKGSRVVIPNQYNDEWAREIADQMGRKDVDRWLQRFYAIGGGVR